MLPFKKIVKCDISAIYLLIIIKFAATVQIRCCNFNFTSLHSQSDENAKSFNFLLFI